MLSSILSPQNGTLLPRHLSFRFADQPGEVLIPIFVRASLQTLLIQVPAFSNTSPPVSCALHFVLLFEQAFLAADHRKQ